MHIILASASPRRQELLKTLNVTLSVVKPDIDERRQAHESIFAYIERNALEKAQAVLKLGLVGDCILAADTVGISGQNLLEKPRDRADAAAMLRQLSGTSHQVVTAFALVGLGHFQDHNRVDRVITDVVFKTLSETEIDAYISTPEPYDKAGAYAIQGLAAYMVTEIRGSYSNVVGLPLTEVATALRDLYGFEALVRPEVKS